MDAGPLQDCVLDRLGDFLRRHPPLLREIVGTVCETYRMMPDEIDGIPRAVVCYFAQIIAGKPSCFIGPVVKLSQQQICWEARNIKKRLDKGQPDDLLRDDLDLIAVRLAERVLVREAQLCV